MPLDIDPSRNLVETPGPRNAYRSAPSAWAHGAWASHVRLMRLGPAAWPPVLEITTTAFWACPATARAFLAGIPAHLPLHATACDRLLTIPSPPAASPEGFDIEVHFGSDCVRASFGGLDQDFATIAGAMTWVERALSATYQLRTVSIGGLPHEWRLAPVAGSRSAGDTLCAGHGRLLQRLRAKTITHRRNPLL